MCEALRLTFTVVAHMVNVLEVFHISIDRFLYVGVADFFFFILTVMRGMQDPQPGIKPTPLQWKHTVLTRGRPGNSLKFTFCN